MIESMKYETCGNCAFSMDDEGLSCFVNPPQPILMDDGQLVAFRAVAVEANDPPCRHWEPRFND